MKFTKPYENGNCLVCLFAYDQIGLHELDQHHCSACNGVLCKGIISCRAFLQDDDEDEDATADIEVPEIGEEATADD